MGTMLDFQANGRTASGYRAVPPQGTGAGLVVIQEWWGLVAHIKDLCDRFAQAGFVSLAPDLFGGTTTKSPDAAGKLLMALNIAEAGKDIRGAARALLDDAAVQPKKVGVVGFCMGGQLAMYAAMEYPDVLSCAVDFYGIHPKVAIDPAKVRVPVLGHFGKKDPSVPEDEARKLFEAIRAAGGDAQAYFYDAGHAFFNDARPEAHDADAARTAWDRTLRFLRQHLS